MSNLYRKYVWLASYPKSGNTWLRFLFQSYLHDRPNNINGMLPCFSGDNRTDMMSKVNKGALPRTAEEYINIRIDALKLNALMYEGNYLLSKTHNAYDEVLFPDDISLGAIYIMRNPWDVAISYSEHLGRNLNNTIVHLAHPDAVAGGHIGRFELTGSWDNHVDRWTSRPKTLIIRYEDLVDDTEKEFRRCLDYLSIPFDEKQMKKALRESSPEYVRAQEEREGFREKPKHNETFFKRCTYGGFKETLTADQLEGIARCFPDQIKKWYPEYAVYDKRKA